MAGLAFEDYEKEIETIKSLRQVTYMHDEIIEFIKRDEPIILSLFKLKEALESNYSVTRKYNIDLLYKKHLIPYDKNNNDSPQDISDLLNFEIDEHDKIEFGSINMDVLNSILEVDAVPKFFPRDRTFYSDLFEEDLIRIGEELFRKGFIKEESLTAFIYAFSNKPISEAEPINWLETYNTNVNSNISLAILIHHISPDETCKDFKQVHDKLFKLFTPSNPPSKDTRSFEASLKKVRIDKYKKTDPNIQLLLSILNS